MILLIEENPASLSDSLAGDGYEPVLVDVPTDDCVRVGEPDCSAVRLNHTTSHRAATAAAVGVADDVRASAGLVTAPEVESDPTSVLSGHDIRVRFGVEQANNLPRQVHLIVFEDS